MNKPEAQSEAELNSPETAIHYPELIANEPLPNTTLVYSVPVMGEWRNGNLLRFLRSTFAQKVADSEAFEVELVANTGHWVERLQNCDPNTFEPMVDKQGNAIIDEQLDLGATARLQAMLDESDQAVEFLRKVVDAQRLARTSTSLEALTHANTQLESLIASETEVLQQQILRLAAEKANSISLAIADMTRKSLRDTPYHSTNLSSLRTLGADLARTRFEANPDLVLHLFDADTIMATNDTVRQTQAIFKQHPELNYLFSNMSNAPTGTEQALVADSPRENVRRTKSYNSDYVHGSPQIAFRMRAYEKLKELSGWKDTGFEGDEDRDTSQRLVYHFGKLQDGLLFEASADLQPTVMTGDRLDGAVDSAGRKIGYEAAGIRHITNDIGRVYELQDKIENLILAEPPDKQAKIRLSLSNARHHFKREQQVQQRFNRWLLKSFVTAVQMGHISLAEGKLHYNDGQIMSLRGGEALLHYIKSNPVLISETVADSRVVAYIQSCLDKNDSSTAEYTEVPPFYQAIGEYIGEVKLVSQLIEDGLLTKPQPEIKTIYGKYQQETWHPQDKRTTKDRVSFMHSMVAETFALNAVYKIFFEVKELERQKRDTYNWPADPNEQELRMNFPDSETRWQTMQQWMDTQGTEIPQPVSADPVGELGQWQSVPMSKLLGRLRSGFRSLTKSQR